MTDSSNVDAWSILREPSTGKALTVLRLREAEKLAGGSLVALRTNGHAQAPPVGPTDFVLGNGDGSYYPIVENIPILLRPEVLGLVDRQRLIDISSPAFDEAYLEMEFYNQFAESQVDSLTATPDFATLQAIAEREQPCPNPFPNPRQVWIDAIHDAQAQFDAYDSIGPLANKRVLQAGGKGLHALKFLLGGASEAWLMTPMIGEASFGRQLADEVGLGDKFHVVVAVAEELPFVDAAVDAVFAGGCAHHFHMPEAMPEAHRILSPGGKFVAVEPYHAPLYDLGTRLFGKREPNAHCSPMDNARIAPLYDTFDDATVVHHGTFFRYPLIAAAKVGLRLPVQLMMGINSVDDWLANKSRLRAHGSSILLCGTREPSTRK